MFPVKYRVWNVLVPHCEVLLGALESGFVEFVPAHPILMVFIRVLIRRHIHILYVETVVWLWWYT